MRQLDLFGSFFDPPPLEPQPVDNERVVKKEESVAQAASSYSKNSLRSERIFANGVTEADKTVDGNREYADKSAISSQPAPASPTLLSLFDAPVLAVEIEVEEDGTKLIVETSLEPRVVEEPQEEVADILPLTAVAEDEPAVEQSAITTLPAPLVQPLVDTVTKPILRTQKKQTQPELQRNGSVIFDDGKITVKLKSTSPFPAPIVKEKKEKIKKPAQKRGRKSFKEIDAEVDLIEIPEDEILFQKQYYPISEVARWFRVNTSLLRYWENEFDVLKPRKNRKGDRLFRPEDVKNLQLIYQLLRQRKYTIEGAKEYIKTNKKKADIQLYLNTTLQKFKSFLLDLKANLSP